MRLFNDVFKCMPLQHSIWLRTCLPLFRPEAVQLQWKMFSINAPLWFLYCTMQSVDSFPVLAVHYSVRCAHRSFVKHRAHGIVCFVIELMCFCMQLCDYNVLGFFFFITFYLLYSGDLLTINIERHCNVGAANVVLSLTVKSS